MNAVIGAVRARNAVQNVKAIQLRFEKIPAGKPQSYGWNQMKERFERAFSSDLSLNLMGPSELWIRRYEQRLPIIQVLSMVTRDPFTSARSTLSNSLSYVMRFNFANQSILITGDTGFSDFVNSGRGKYRKYHPALLALLHDLNVIQIAHHGGAAHRFYQAFVAAGVKTNAYLLLSHGEEDGRPQAAFSEFVKRIQLNEDTFFKQVLLTNTPKAANVKSIKGSFCAVTPPGSAKKGGDARLTWDCCTGNWAVVAHVVQHP